MMYASVVHGLPVSRCVVVPSLNVLTRDSTVLSLIPVYCDLPF